jgi:hypothetical protein
VAHFGDGAGRQRCAGVLTGEQPQSRQVWHAPCVIPSRAVCCGHGGGARRVQAQTVVRLSRIPPVGRGLLRALRSSVRAGACRDRTHRLGRHPPVTDVSAASQPSARPVHRARAMRTVPGRSPLG